MIEEIDRANSIITEFLSLTKNKPLTLQKENLNQIIKNLSPLIAADAMLYDKDIKINLENIPDLQLDIKEIRQLILNLARNGLEAMLSGGTLTIRTFLEDDEVVLAIKDQGIGIKTHLLEKIGTPFFTTKDTGTGLGLAICYSIASRHNATIRIQTGPDGTSFFVCFRQQTETI
jgi:signal transduction histidine kinase